MHTMTAEMRCGNNKLGKEECLSIRHPKNRGDVVYSTKQEYATEDECLSKGRRS